MVKMWGRMIVRLWNSRSFCLAIGFRKAGGVLVMRPKAKVAWGQGNQYPGHVKAGETGRFQEETRYVSKRECRVVFHACEANWAFG